MAVSPEDGETDVAVDGVRSVVTVGGRPGSESAVVFVHGALGSRRDWATLVEEVAAFGRAVAPDMPGYGDADKPESFDYTTQGYARHLGGLLEERSPGPPRPRRSVGARVGRRAPRRARQSEPHQHRRFTRLPLAPVCPHVPPAWPR